MKKILLFFTLFMCISAHALEEAKIEEVLISDVYTNYTIDGKKYCNPMSYKYADGNIAYCIELDKYITSKTYNKSLDTSSIDLHVMTSSYFGYPNFGNTDMYDYLATQKLIWWFLGYDVYYTNSCDSDAKTIDVSSNEDKIKYSVTSYGWFPYFDSDFKFDVGKTYQLYDSNNLMNNSYHIIDYTGNLLSNIDNGIEIKNYYSGNHKFTLERVYDYLSDNVVYTSDNSQKLYHGGNLKSLKRDYNYQVTGAKLNIKFISSDDNFNVGDNIFELYKDNNLVGCYYIDDIGNLNVSNLNLGTYILKHTFSKSFELMDDYEIIIDKVDNNDEIILNTIKKNIIIKTLYNNPIINFNTILANKEINITNDTTNYTTDENGILTLNLVIGNYTIKCDTKEYEITEDDFKDDINIEFIFDNYDANVNIYLYDSNFKSVDETILIDDDKYITKEGFITINNLKEGIHKLSIISDNYKEITEKIILDENSDFYLKDNKVYIDYYIELEKIIINNDTPNNNIIDELPNLGA